MAEEAKHIKTKALSITEKLQIVNQYDTQDFSNTSAFAKEKVLSESTLRTLLKKRDAIVNEAVFGETMKKKSKIANVEDIKKIIHMVGLLTL